MNTQFKLIGFDLDGTLVNSLPDLALSVNSALTEFSLPQASEELVLTWIGNGAPVLIARALDWACAQSGRELTASEIEKVKARFNFYYGENLCNVSRLYPNVKETLENLNVVLPNFTLSVDIIVYGEQAEPISLANRLYDSLLQFNDIGVDTLIVEGCAPVGLGVAVMNRLEKASGGHVQYI